MPPRLRLRIVDASDFSRLGHEASYVCRCRRYATVAATTPAASIPQMTTSVPPMSRYSPTQPPSHRAPEARRSQLLREYVSLLHTTPLFILFQHNNLKAGEWVGIRRELNAALQKLDASLIADGKSEQAIGSSIKLQVIRPTIFEPALRVAEYYRPPPAAPSVDPTDPATSSSAEGIPNATISPSDPLFTHALSRQAHDAVYQYKNKHPLIPLLSGPVALLTFPTVSPQYIKASLQILAPQAPNFPAPTRRANPGYWDPAVQSGVQKLMLLGARVEERIFDMDGTKWVGTIEGGIDGLRAQLVQMLQGFGAGVTGALESASRSLYFAVEGRKMMLEEDGKEKTEDKPAEGDTAEKSS